jgi:hypothetical protein
LEAEWCSEEHESRDLRLPRYEENRMGWLIVIVIIVILFVLFRKGHRVHVKPTKNGYIGLSHRRMSQQERFRRSRLIRGKGRKEGEVCPVPRCNLPAALCRHKTREAETARGMGQKP